MTQTANTWNGLKPNKDLIALIGDNQRLKDEYRSFPRDVRVVINLWASLDEQSQREALCMFAAQREAGQHSATT